MSGSSIAYLTKPGTEVQHYYLVTFLRMLCRYQVMRMHTVAYALFPTRAQSAAMAAAQRVVHNAAKKNYITHVNWMNGRRYYALTSKGARFLNELTEDYGARPTATALRKQNKDHREWCTLIAIASDQRGMRGFGEAEISGGMHTDIMGYFGHIPDAITLVENGDKRAAVWHEVETSRRSTTRRTSTPNELCGAEKFVRLVRTLQDKHHLVHEAKEWPLLLAVHCGSARIEREIRALIERVGGIKDERGYTLPFARGGELQVIINKLTCEHEGAWAGVLPWTGCPRDPQGPVDRFVQRQVR